MPPEPRIRSPVARAPRVRPPTGSPLGRSPAFAAPPSIWPCQSGLPRPGAERGVAHGEGMPRTQELSIRIAVVRSHTADRAARNAAPPVPTDTARGPGAARWVPLDGRSVARGGVARVFHRADREFLVQVPAANGPTSPTEARRSPLLTEYPTEPRRGRPRAAAITASGNRGAAIARSRWGVGPGDAGRQARRAADAGGKDEQSGDATARRE